MKHTTISGNQRGATAVEFAIILPLLLLVVFGMIEISLLLFNKHVITHACREGARAGIVARRNRFQPGDEVNVRDVVSDWIGGHLITFGASNEPQVDVEIVDKSTGDPADWESIVDDPDDPDDGPCTAFHCPLWVTVDYDYDFLVLSIFGFGPISLRSRAVMLME